MYFISFNNKPLASRGPEPTPGEYPWGLISFLGGRERLEALPLLDLRANPTTTRYFDEVGVEDMTAPVMRLADAQGRVGLAFLDTYEQPDGQHVPIVRKLLQYYTIDEITQSAQKNAWCEGPPGANTLTTHAMNNFFNLFKISTLLSQAQHQCVPNLLPAVEAKKSGPAL